MAKKSAKTPVSGQAGKEVAASRNPAVNPKVKQVNPGAFRATIRKAKGAPRGW